MYRVSNVRRFFGASFAAIGLIGALVAQAAERDIAEVHVHANGAEQRVEVDMNSLSEGQSRQLSADSGLPAIVTRTPEGLRVEMAGETHEIHLPPIELVDLGGGDTGKHIVIKRAGGDSAEGKQEVRVIHRTLDGEVDEAQIEAMLAEALAEAEAARAAADDAHGQALQAAEQARKVRVIRRIERERTGEEG
ncbi:MAG: hypothetical protein ACK5PG_11760 [Lysobacterales bacterium]